MESKDINKNKITRRAILNSYAVGGVYAHLLVEEFENTGIIYNNELIKKHLIILSAGSKNQLKDYAKLYVAYLKKDNDISLHDIACNLQNGRESMSERLAIISKSTNELITKFEKYINGVNDKNIFYGKKSDNSIATEIAEPETIQFKEAYEKRNFNTLAILWVNGTIIPWGLINKKPEYNKISLPTYPFEKIYYPIIPDDEALNIREEMPDESGNNFQYDENESFEKNVQLYLKQIISSLLKFPVERILEEKNLLEYGFDSLKGMKLINIFNDHYGVRISLNTLYKYSTVKEIANYLINKNILKNSDINKMNVKTSIIAEKDTDIQQTKTDYTHEKINNQDNDKIQEMLFWGLEKGKISPEQALEIGKRILITS